MKSILTQLAQGKKSLEPRFFNPGDQYGRTLEALSVIESKLLAVLKEEDLRLFKEFSEMQSVLNHLSNTDQFVYGYRLGALITTEVFMETNSLAEKGLGNTNE